MRSWWISELGKAARGAEGWFNNIEWIIHYFSGTPELRDLNGWASAADAALIWVIQEGFREVWRGERAVTDYGAKWADFFRAAGNRIQDTEQMKGLWGAAEEAGTMFGRAYAEGVVGFPSDLEGELLRAFIKEGDNYRSVLTRGTCNGCFLEDFYKGLDPRHGLAVYMGAKLVEQGVRDYYNAQPEHFDWAYWYWRNRQVYGVP